MSLGSDAGSVDKAVTLGDIEELFLVVAGSVGRLRTLRCLTYGIARARYITVLSILNCQVCQRDRAPDVSIAKSVSMSAMRPGALQHSSN